MGLVAGGVMGAPLFGTRDLLAQDAAPTGSCGPEEGPASLPPHEASWYERLPGGSVRCGLCPSACETKPGQRGACGVRENRDGTYYSLVWGKACALNADPIEKKPFFHYRPGTRTLSLATAGCNLRCRFCQNWNISQAAPEDVRPMRLPPGSLVRLAKKYHCPSIAFTYTEPVVFAEYMRDTAIEARNAGIETVMVSNGYIQREPMVELCRILAAVKIDLKAFTDRFYRELTGAKGVGPVMRTLETVRESGTWLEIVNLVIPTWNDSDGEVRKMTRWIARNLGRDVPVHFTQFHPTYKLRGLPRTPVATLLRLREVALAEGLHYVYVGNVPGQEAEHTRCPECGGYVIRRLGHSVIEDRIRTRKGKAACPDCGHAVPGRF